MKTKAESKQLYEIIKDVRYEIIDSWHNNNLINYSENSNFSLNDFQFLKNLLLHFNKKSFVFITGHNSFGIKKDFNFNIQANLKLRNDIANLLYLEVNTIFENNIDENGFLVFDLPFEMMIILMNKYEQNAVIMGNLKEIKLLINDK